MTITGGKGDSLDARSSGTRYIQAYEELRSLLLSGSIEPNTRLTEADLTTKFNVSRGTMRAVLARLVQDQCRLA